MTHVQTLNLRPGLKLRKISPMLASGEEDLVYMGLALVGNKKKINKHTGSLSLLR